MIKKILCLPGYLVIAFIYFFPTETGRGRNTVRSSRWWSNRDAMAPIISIYSYIVLGIVIISYSQDDQRASSLAIPKQITNQEQKNYIQTYPEDSINSKEINKSALITKEKNIVEGNKIEIVNESESNALSIKNETINSTVDLNDVKEPIEINAQRLLSHQ